MIFSKLQNNKQGYYMPYAEFQSHEPDFDYLKSLEIDERINQIQWCKPTNNALFLLSTNDKTIKLWKVFNKTVRYFEDEEELEGDEDRYRNDKGGALGPGQMVSVRVFRLGGGGVGSDFFSDMFSFLSLPFPCCPSSQIKFPKKQASETTIVANPRRVYANAHNYHINSISNNCDGETYISADDLRINLWNTEVSDSCYNIVDIKPEAMEDLTEVITSAQFAPSHCHIMIHSSSKGVIKIGDMRASALMDHQAKVLKSPPTLDESRSFFSEIISSISDAKFSPDGRYIVSRDYMSLKLWDVNMDSRPVKTIRLQQHLVPRLVQLYENDCIFDKFECTCSGNGKYIATGAYNGVFNVFDASTANLETSVNILGNDEGKYMRCRLI